MPAPVWPLGPPFATYGYRDRQRVTIPFEIEDQYAFECPRSFISQKSKLLVNTFSSADLVREETGQSPMGDPSEWPGWMVDAALAINIAKIRYENAKNEAEQNFK